MKDFAQENSEMAYLWDKISHIPFFFILQRLTIVNDLATRYLFLPNLNIPYPVNFPPKYPLSR